MSVPFPLERAHLRANIGRRLREALDGKAGRPVTQRQLAKLLPAVKGSSTITGWVQGVTQPSLEELAVICDLTGVTADWILGRGELSDDAARVVSANDAIERALEVLGRAREKLNGEK